MSIRNKFKEKVEAGRQAATAKVDRQKAFTGQVSAERNKQVASDEMLATGSVVGSNVPKPTPKPKGIPFNPNFKPPVEAVSRKRELENKDDFNINTEISSSVSKLSPGAELTGEQQAFQDNLNKFLEAKKDTEEKNIKLAGKGITASQDGQKKLDGKSEVLEPEVLPSSFAGTQFQGQEVVAQNSALQSTNMANSNFEADERLRRNELIGSLNQTDIGQAVASEGGTLSQLTTPQLEELALSNGFDLSQKVKDRITLEKRNFLENMKIEQTRWHAQNKFSQEQLSNSYGRAITDREEFNVQQDAKRRRLAAAFGGGKASSLSSNVAVMNEENKGLKIVERMREDFTSKQTLLTASADSVISTYTNNSNLIQAQMSALIQDEYAKMADTVDNLIDQGVTNRDDLNNAIAQAKNQYVKDYYDISDKARTFIQKENQQLFDNQLKLQQFQAAKDQAEQTNFFRRAELGLKQQEAGGTFGGGLFGGTQGGNISSPTTDTSNMQGIGKAPNSDNCVLWAREQVTNLPYGLWTKADKKRAVLEEGSTEKSKIQSGDAILTSEGNWGHVAIVQSVGEDGTLVLEEANYKRGELTQGREINRDDNKIYGFVRSTTGPAVNIGGNIEKEGSNNAIMAQMQEGDGISGRGGIDNQIISAVEEFNRSGQARKDEIMQDARKAGVFDQFIQGLESEEQLSGMKTAEQVRQGESQEDIDAMNIFSGTSKVSSFGTARKEALQAPLDALRQEALKRGDIIGVLRASAVSDSRPSEGFKTKISKTATVISQLTGLKDAIDRASGIDEEGNVISKTKGFFGGGALIGRIRNLNPFDKERRELEANLIGITPNLARGVFGEVGVLTDNDIRLYQQTLPNITQPKDLQDAVLALTLRTVRNALDTTIEAELGTDISGLERPYVKLTKQIKDIEKRLGIGGQQAAPKQGQPLNFTGTTESEATAFLQNAGLPNPTSEDINFLLNQ